LGYGTALIDSWQTSLTNHINFRNIRMQKSLFLRVFKENLMILRTILIIDWHASLSISIILITYKSQNSLTIRVL